jgi:copper homeostasis protein
MSEPSAMEFEVCAESAEACVAAREGGATRIELCSALSEGGLTPSHGLIQQAVQCSGLPVHIILRPRGGDFVYSDTEFEVMRADLLHAAKMGVSGFVLGILDSGRKIDVERTKALVSLAEPLQVTFHRAFDCVPDQEKALEDVIAAGCGRLLTSGGKPDVLQGAATIERLVTQASGRIRIAVGGGLRLANAQEVARITGANAFHGSLRAKISSPHGCVPGEADCFGSIVKAEDVREMIRTLNVAFAG